MNILLVTADLDLGGAQQVVVNITNEFIRQNHNVWIFDVEPQIRSKGMIERLDEKAHLISKDYNNIKLSFYEKVLDFILLKLKIKTNNSKILFQKHEKNLKKVISENKISYVNSHVCWADFYVLQKIKPLHKNWIITLHASYNDLLVNRNNIIKYGQLTKNTIIAASKIIHIHDEGLNFLEKVLQIKINKSKKILNGIPQQTINPKIKRSKFGINKKDFVILCASRAIKSKGWYELAKAVAETMDPRVKLLFAGDGEILKDIKDAFSEYKSKIKFLGFQKDIHSLIHLSDLVCLPSQTEALPTILLESIFCNKLTLATKVGETANILENKKGKCGVLIKANKGEELVNSLVNAINSLMSENLTFDKEAFDLASEIFSVEKMAKNYLHYFSEK